MTERASPTIPTRNALLESAVQALRQEWKNGFDGRAAGEAERIIRSAQQSTSDPAAAMKLAQSEVRLADYAHLPSDRRADALKAIAADLKHQITSDSRSENHTRNQPLPPPPKHKPVRTQVPARTLSLDQSVTALPRVGTAVGSKLGKLGIKTVGDVIRLLPRRHIDYSKSVSIQEAIGFGQRGEVTVRGRITDITSYPGPPPRVTVRLTDHTGSLKVTWFNPYLAKQLKVNDEIAISGEIDRGYGMPTATSPEWERIGGPSLSTGRLTPVYPLTQGVAQKTLRGLTRAALDSAGNSIQDHLPAQLVAANDLMPLQAALFQAHYPDDWAALKRSQLRLSFDDLFLLQLGLLRLKTRREMRGGFPMDFDYSLLEAFVRSLPFQLTGGQQRVLDEVIADIQKPVPMSRLLQGDVGSGKTVVAAAGALASISSGYQAAVMAPTEILANQHFVNLGNLFANLPDESRPSIALLTGSTKKSERAILVEAAATGGVDLLVGTHALIQDGVEFEALGFVVVDEQHRFGVRQRAELLAKSAGTVPHLLAMSATPIPRSLHMVLNGDSEVSVIDELPPGRVPIETRRYKPETRHEAYQLVRSQIEEGRQVFVICPLVEESDAIDAKAAIAEGKRLQEQVFPELRVGVLHGRMSGKEKDRVMESFRTHGLDILVSTSVIEVGIDIPNATIMLIEGADRFGLAQLHQFRGRVGRGSHRSYCLLLAEDASTSAEQRLDMMVRSSDGFELAEKDLQLRGPGDFVGTRQSGLPEMTAFANGFDTRVLDSARRAAATLLETDPELSAPEHALLRDRLSDYWAQAAPDLALS